MGTRSTLQFNSKENDLTVVIYRHWDGYPSSNLNDLYKALNNISENLQGNKQENIIDEFLKIYEGEPRKGYEKHHQKRNLDNSMEHCGPYQSDLYDTNQWDLEWCYLIDIDNKTIEVFGGSYGTQSELSAKGPISPFKEVDMYDSDNKEPYRFNILYMLQKLSAIGWKVNPIEENKKEVA